VSEWIAVECYEREYHGWWMLVRRVGGDGCATDRRDWKWRVARWRSEDGHGGWAETLEAAQVAAEREIDKLVEYDRPRCRRRVCGQPAVTAGLCSSHYRGG